jgi:hypothetical protein
MVSKKRLFKFPRYWYHLSKKLTDKEILLTPKDDSVNRSIEEPDGARICVSPTIEQCITALVYNCYQTYNIYRTKKRLIAKKPPKGAIFDGRITDEGWIEIPTVFVKIGEINFEKMQEFLDKNDIEIIEESASGGGVEYCNEVLIWWKKRKIDRFIDWT